MAELDLTNQQIREMAHRNHLPEEIWMSERDGGSSLLSVQCEMCKKPYPCPTRVTLTKVYDL
jgi:hypothetical protein